MGKNARYGSASLSARAKDGRWSYLHTNFPNHRAAALKVLGVTEESRAAVAKAVATWTAQGRRLAAVLLWLLACAVLAFAPGP